MSTRSWSRLLLAVCLTYGVAAPVMATEAEPSYANKPLKHWVKQLKGKDTRQVNEALQALAAIGAPAATALIPLLADKEYSVRTRAAGALVQIGPAAREAAPALIEALSDPRSGVARYEGGSMSFTLAVPEAQAFRMVVIIALVAIGDGTEPALLAALKHADQLVRVGAAAALDARGRPLAEATPALLDALKDAHPEVRAAAGRILARQGEGAVPVLITALQGGDALARRGAALALGELGQAGGAAVLALTATLRDEDKGVREDAAEALGKLSPLPPPGIAGLVETLKDKEDSVRLAAATALAKNQAKEAVPVLLEAFEDDTGRDQTGQAFGALKEMMGPDPGLAIVSQIVDRAGAARRVKAVRALGEMGNAASAAVPALVRAQEDKSQEVREAAVEALAKIRGVR